MKNIFRSLAIAALIASSVLVVSCGGGKEPVGPTPDKPDNPDQPKDTTTVAKDTSATGGGVLPQLKLPPDTVLQLIPEAAKSITSNIFGYNTQTIQGSAPAWNDPLFLNSIRELNPGNFRYPGGTIGNFWNWQTGDYIDESYRTIAINGKNIYTLDDVKGVYDRSGGHTIPIYMVNPLTSNLEHEVAGLKYAQSIGLPVTCIELGNELYLDNYNSVNAATSVYLQGYPWIRNYADTCLKWTVRFRQEFPNASIALIGVSNPTSWAAARTRVRSWNDSLMVYLTNPAFGHTGIQCDAITIHDYAKNNNGNLMGPLDLINSMLSAATNKVLDPSIYDKYRLWVTEYNMTSNQNGLAGSWADGLASLLMSAEFIVTPRIDYICFFDLAGSQDAGALYNKDVKVTTDPAQGAVTVRKDSISASGRAMTLLANAQQEANSVCVMDFTPVNPTITAPISGKALNTLWAFRFGSATTPAAVLVNIGGTSQYVSLQGLAFPLHRAEQLWAPTLTRQIVSMDTSPGETFSNGDYKRQYIDLSTTSVITLRPYSATLVK